MTISLFDEGVYQTPPSDHITAKQAYEYIISIAAKEAMERRVSETFNQVEGA